MDRQINMDLEQYPQAAMLVRHGRVAAANELARHYLPALEVGGPAPEELEMPEQTAWLVGVLCIGGDAYDVRKSDTEQGELYLFTPAPDMGLTRLQLDNALMQLRLLMGELLIDVGPYAKAGMPPLSPDARAKFNKNYHRMLRLMENMEYVNGTTGDCSMCNVDVAQLWADLSQQVESLLLETGTKLEFICHDPYLMVLGDPPQLRRMLLGLLSNALRAARGGVVKVRLKKQGGRVLLSVEDTANAATQRGRVSILGQDTPGKLPVPGEGAGLGMEVVRGIVRRHKGTLLVHWDESSTQIVISLPQGGGSPYVSVQAPKVDRYGGFHELMVELADVLPAKLFGMDDME